MKVAMGSLDTRDQLSDAYSLDMLLVCVLFNPRAGLGGLSVAPDTQRHETGDS